MALCHCFNNVSGVRAQPHFRFCSPANTHAPMGTVYEAPAIIFVQVHDRLESGCMKNIIQSLDQRPLVLFRSRGSAYGQVGAVDVGEHGSASAMAVLEVLLGSSDTKAAANTNTARERLPCSQTLLLCLMLASILRPTYKQLLEQHARVG